ncbi:hypothetical protein BAUCODRAFT_30304 [Baudoinia panamericana UAMH 10762]|uniref:Uncharacterized protein n=1 Tax=Baudoinia panamericana (strain UAMH 10762) TaxID=717646 RepID=M2N707_BAUPA|nr:uncharacterized protein BAUCODRAFT_30304 [Baudoinia panamericana UAMH 10762]EMC99888.1 hypothetical protein BAUCODRAFT_30304 [Baudoinia panamericana UAMH 10762]
MQSSPASAPLPAVLGLGRHRRIETVDTGSPVLLLPIGAARAKRPSSLPNRSQRASANDAPALSPLQP